MNYVLAGAFVFVFSSGISIQAATDKIPEEYLYDFPSQPAPQKDPKKCPYFLTGRRRIWTKEKIIQIIQLLHEKEIPLWPWALQNDVSDETSKLIVSVLGRKGTGRNLYQRAIARFGSWPKALIAAGLDPEKIYKKRPPGQDFD